MAQIEVRVSQENIDNGLLSDSTQCAIALALTEAGIKFESVVVPSLSFHKPARVEWSPNLHSKLPYEVWKWARQFDAGETVEPISFTLEVPS